MKPIKILMLEDNASDCELIRHELEKSSYDFETKNVETENDFKQEIDNYKPDLILSDYTIPSFNGLSALKMAQSKAKDVPFIFVSGTIGEERAIDALKMGAVDYILKDNLNRLVPAVERALREARAQKKIKKSEEKLIEQSIFLDKAQDAIFAHNLEGVITFWNKSAEKLYGWKAEDVINWKITDVLQKQMSSQYSKAWEHVMKTGEWIGELHQGKKKGDSVIVESRWTMIQHQENRPASILVINTDITEKRKLEAQFYHAQRLENIGALVGGIAHDLNNILSPILMAVQLLKQQIKDSKSNKMFKAIEVSAQRGAEIVGQFLSFAKGTNEQQSAVQLRYVLKDYERLIKATFPKSIDLSVNNQKNLWYIEADSTKLNQIILNLCVNARDAMPEGGNLTISANNYQLDVPIQYEGTQIPEGKYVQVSVSDTGTGIPEESLEKIFKPFYTTKSSDKGTGLGLSTVKNVIKNHNGFMRVNSKVGEGTTFELYFPAISSSAHSTPATAETQLPKGNGELIMVVDDEVSILNMIKQSLEFFGYRVITADSGGKAIDLYGQHYKDIECVIVDRYMPLMGGKTTIKEIQNVNDKVHFILISGAINKIESEELKKLNIDAYIQKPYTTEKMVKTVYEVIKQN